ncbi:MAG: helix-turn-helix transcriptional regulator [Acidobacteriaceae bacterium]
MLNNLKLARANKEWSQAEMAEMLEISRQSVHAIETGKYDPSLPLAMRIARLFGRRVEDIFKDVATERELELKRQYAQAK